MIAINQKTYLRQKKCYNNYLIGSLNQKYIFAVLIKNIILKQ